MFAVFSADVTICTVHGASKSVMKSQSIVPISTTFMERDAVTAHFTLNTNVGISVLYHTMACSVTPPFIWSASNSFKM